MEVDSRLIDLPTIVAYVGSRTELSTASLVGEVQGLIERGEVGFRRDIKYMLMGMQIDELKERVSEADRRRADKYDAIVYLLVRTNPAKARRVADNFRGLMGRPLLGWAYDAIDDETARKIAERELQKQQRLCELN